MSALIKKFREGFPLGYSAITTEEEAVGMDFGIFKMKKNELHQETNPKEVVWVLIKGSAELEFSGQKVTVSRESLFDDAPTALSLGPKTAIKIKSLSDDLEWSVAKASNPKTFEAKLYLPTDLSPEYRGKGLVQDASLRNVRLIYDYTTRPESNLVIGEVVNFPGRWSSYPPHHHDQPEVYHYRFTLPQGYGLGENGDDVFKIKQFDTLKILGGLDHCQVSAPGYGMYYLWIVRHLDNNPYKGFTYTPEHEWLLNPANQGWKPKL